MRKRTTSKLAETYLYHPVRDFLEAQGYTVRAEVRDCDITAIRGDDLIIVELKRAFSTSLLVQATQRQKATDSVYVALPRPKGGVRTARWRGIEHLLKRLELGLILVSPRSKVRKVDVIFHPLPHDRKKRRADRRAILREIEGRSGDYNKGGSTRRPIMTAYRENALYIACALERSGALSPKALRDLGTGPKTLSILYTNVYGWFERIDRGIYDLRPAGRAAIKQYAKPAKAYFAELDRHQSTVQEESKGG